MNLLAIEASTETLSLAVQAGSQRYAVDAPGGAAASREVINHIVALLAKAELASSALDAIVFGQGPGSFTGIRTACAVAQGLAYPYKIPLLPICGLLAVAHCARAAGCGDTIMACLDARMEQVYVAQYRWTIDQWVCELQPTTMAPAAVDAAGTWAIAGNAYTTYLPQWRGSATHHFALPSASVMLDLAPALWHAGHGVDASLATPLYVRNRVALNTQERMAGEKL